MGDQEQRPTIYVLAKLAGVSTGTVSRALNNRPMVSSETRERVLDLAHWIGLKPQASIRNQQIALVTEPTWPDHAVGYAATMTASLSLALAKQGVGIIVPSDPRSLTFGAYFDGIVAITYSPELKVFLKEMESRVPVVYLDNFEAAPEQYVVCSDHYASGYESARLFMQAGCKAPGFAGRDVTPFRERLRGFRDGIKEFGGELNERLYYLARGDESLYAIVSCLVRAGADGLFVPGATLEAGEALHVLQNVMRLRVPEDVALIGGESEKVSKFLSPPLTTVAEPLHAMADRAAEMALALCEGRKVEKHQYVFPFEAIERESV